jgi:hypothetical protein
MLRLRDTEGLTMTISRFSTSRTCAMAAVAALATAGGTPASAQGGKAAEPVLQSSYPTDSQMDCAQLVAEIARMDSIMGVSDQAVASAQGGARAAELGASVGVNAALYSGALGRVPGLGLFANAAAGAAKRNAQAKAEREAERKRTAEMRRMLLTGLHGGKNCGAAQAPVATPVQPAATPAAAPVSPTPGAT